MKVVKFLVSLAFTLGLIYLLDNPWTVGGITIPPLGKFLDPFHGFWQNIETSEKPEHQNLEIDGLQAPVTVLFDSLLIPHIFASNESDLYLAQGYVTAMHRLWQMEFQTHAAAGRLSEIIANDAILDYDRAQRRLGMTYGARNFVRYIESEPIIRNMVEKYTEGVNQYIRSLRYEDLPFEYKLLDYRPEPWTPLKVALLLKSMSQTLNMADKDMEMTNALRLFGKATVDLLYPDDEHTGDAIVEKPGKWNFRPTFPENTPLALPDDLVKLNKLPGPSPNNGSNNWAVSGSKTATGAPILCGDPHLTLRLPSIWYAIQLNAPGINAMGVSLPGAPCIVIGFNDSIAWSMTNSQRDLVDWFHITFQDEKRDKYLLDDGWASTKKVIEEIRIRGRQPFYDTVIYTHWGPVTYDRHFRSDNNRNGYAFRWISHDASAELMALYLLNRAHNYNDFMNALNYFSAPAQNFAFASVSGDIAMRVQGKFPVRRKEEGKFVLDGSKTSNGWQLFIPNEQNIMDKNPPRGFVSSANQYPADETYPYYITARSYEAYRNRRINQVLEESDSLTVTDMMALQNDNFNLKAAESLPLFLSYLDTVKFYPEEKEAYRILKDWDYFNHAESIGAAYYEAWWDNLMPLIWDELDRKDTLLTLPTTYTTIKLLREKPDLSFFDILSTPEKESAGDVIRKAFARAVQDIEQWQKDNGNPVTWGRYKDAYISHLLQPLKPLSATVNAGGNHDIVNAHSRTHGPSWRMIVSLEKTGVQAWAVYPGGQSGNPGSRHYTEMIEKWKNGQYYPLLFLKNPGTKTEDIYASVQLNPTAK